MQNTAKALLFGFLVWLIPFVSAFFFYSPSGEIAVSEDLFKSIMIVISTFGGIAFLYLYFKNVSKQYFRNGIAVGIIWFIVNILLDIVILIPMSGMTYSEYMNQIGIRYLSIPLMAGGIGYILEKKLA